MLCLASLTLVLGLELPVSGSGPGGHGPGAEVGVLAGLRGQLQTHGGDVALPDGDHVPDETQRTSRGSHSDKGKEADWCGLFQLLVAAAGWRRSLSDITGGDTTYGPKQASGWTTTGDFLTVLLLQPEELSRD